MIESMNDASRNLEKALQVLEQAKQRVANEKKKQNEKKRKAENHHKYIMGGIIVKYFPDCYRYDEGELNRILSVALQTRECNVTQASQCRYISSVCWLSKYLQLPTLTSAPVTPKSDQIQPKIPAWLYTGLSY